MRTLTLAAVGGLGAVAVTAGTLGAAGGLERLDGAPVLSGDAVHFRDNWENQRVPSMNFNRDQTLASLQRIATVLEERKAQLWIGHDKAQSAQLRYSAAYYE